jgi:alpha-D-xyloside xylohydrolase
MICARFHAMWVAGALLAVTGAAAWAGAAAPEKVADGVLVPIGSATLKIEVCTDSVIRIAYAPSREFFTRTSVVTAPRQCEGATWDVRSSTATVTVKTARLQVQVNRTTGAVSFLDAHGAPILREADRSLDPAEVQGERTFHVRQRWRPHTGESLYGLGQHQLGLMDIKGYDLDLWQYNVSAVVPVLVSSRGYGLLWDNLSLTRFGDLRAPQPIPASRLLDEQGARGGLTGHYFAGAHFERPVATRVDPDIDIHLAGATGVNARIHPALPAEGDVSVRWQGFVVPPVSGTYSFHAFSNAGLKIWIDGRLESEHWRQGWLPWKDEIRVPMVAGRRYAIKVEWSKDQGDTCQLRWKTPNPSSDTSLWSEVGDGVDYYFLYGPDLDAVVAGYRHVTGQAPMMPRWAFGFWQSRERYKTQQESLDVLAEFRRRHIPLDVMVQDWQYWKIDQWGSHQFDKERFPDPDAWIRQIHEQHAKLMISVWGKFYPGTDNFRALHDAGYLYDGPLTGHYKDWLGYPYTFYDAFNAGARQMFWDQVKPALFDKGVDAWWMDATEPDLVQPLETLEGQRTLANPTGMGTGARVLNGYSLLNSQGIYEGQRATRPDQRVFILTRSAFAGQQRYASATWSGDITTTWTAFRRQIPAGLGFSLSGVPYWATDTGGFAVTPAFAHAPQSPADAAEWKELNVRWFQYSTFCPLLRVHGQWPNREMWFLGGESDPAYQTELKFDRLRYRLLPYTYSLAGDVTHHAGTMLRPLVMDFPDDVKVRNLGDEFLFGPAFLVSPVTTYQARTRKVYLPAGAAWYDFWTGQSLVGGQTIDAPAPYDTMPLHIRAGSIVPVGPALEYTDEKPPDPITLYVYAGADGHFTLYEDDGASYQYEHGAYAEIPIAWNDARGALTIGARQGSFDGMLAERTFRVVLVSKTTPLGYGTVPASAKTVRYTGAETLVDLMEHGGHAGE